MQDMQDMQASTHPLPYPGSGITLVCLLVCEHVRGRAQSVI